MNITIRINTDSTAFEKDPDYEVYYTLSKLAHDLYYDYYHANKYENRRVLDSNGQVCGSVEVQESEARE